MLLSGLSEGRDRSYQRGVTGKQLALRQARSRRSAAPQNKGASVTSGVKTPMTAIAHVGVLHFEQVARWEGQPVKESITIPNGCTVELAVEKKSVFYIHVVFSTKASLCPSLKDGALTHG